MAVNTGNKKRKKTSRRAAKAGREGIRRATERRAAAQAQADATIAAAAMEAGRGPTRIDLNSENAMRMNMRAKLDRFNRNAETGIRGAAENVGNYARQGAEALGDATAGARGFAELGAANLGDSARRAGAAASDFGARHGAGEAMEGARGGLATIRGAANMYPKTAAGIAGAGGAAVLGGALLGGGDEGAGIDPETGERYVDTPQGRIMESDGRMSPQEFEAMWASMAG